MYTQKTRKCLVHAVAILIDHAQIIITQRT